MTEWDPEIQRHDIRKLPYSDGSVDAVYSSHTLEHVYIDEARQVLREVSRVLKPGGLVRLALPDAEQLARAFIARVDDLDADAGWDFNDALLAHPRSPPSGLHRLLSRAGGHTHRWQPTPAMVTRMLEEAGFSDVRRYEYQKGTFPDLSGIETKPDSFFLEALLTP